MGKRFADTNKYKKPFIRSLPGAYKLLWDFLYLDCDHAGIWIVDFDVAQMYIGKDMPISRETAVEHFNRDEIRIHEFDGGKKWFIIPFIEFQYGRLTEKNKALNSVVQILRKHGFIDENLKINILPSSPLQGAKEMVKDKELEMDMDFGKSENLLAPKMVRVFKQAYPKYPDDRDADYPACVQIALKIAKSKGWMKEAVTNGKLDETVSFWAEIVDFSTSDSWLSTRSISDFNKEYQRIIQKMNNGGTTHQQVPTGSNKLGTSDARIKKASEW
jgi:hypothetical protein